MSPGDRLVRVELEVTCRVRGDLDESELAAHFARELTRRAFNLAGAVVCPTAASIPVHAEQPPRHTRRRRPPTPCPPDAAGRGAPR